MVDDETRGTRADPAAPTVDGSIAAVGVAPTELPSDETMVPSWGASAFAALPDPGYQIGELIGKGGMGEVVAAQDQRIGREVAVKRIRAREPSADAVSRFLREARIQARLDHPAIFDMRGSFDELALVIGNLIFVVSAGLVAVYITRRRMDAQRQMHIQAWHLRQLLPNAKRWQTGQVQR